MPIFNMVAESKLRDPAGQLGSRPTKHSQKMGTPVKPDDLGISANIDSFGLKSGLYQRENNSTGYGSEKRTRSSLSGAIPRAQTYRPSIRGGRGGASAGRYSSRSMPVMSQIFTTPGATRHLGHDFNAISESELKREIRPDHRCYFGSS